MAKARGRPKAGNEKPLLSGGKKPGLKALETILTSDRSPIDITEIAYQFMHQVGGPAGFVERIMGEYDGSPVGSLARSRVLDIMVRLFQIATPKDKQGDLGHLTDEDLEVILRKQLMLSVEPPAPVSQEIDHFCI